MEPLHFENQAKWLRAGDDARARRRARPRAELGEQLPHVEATLHNSSRSAEC